MIHLILAFAFAIIAAIIYEYFHNIPLLLSISSLAIIAIIIVELRRRRKEKNKALKGSYTFIGKSSSLTPEVVLGIRPFGKYYYRRKEDDLIDESLRNKKNLLIIGPPLSGKSRAVYEALINLPEPQNLIVPRCKDINPETLLFPKNTKIIVIDDLHKFVEKQNLEYLLNASIQNSITIVATCRSAMEYKKVKHKIDLETIFENIIELPEISSKVGEEIAKEVKKDWGKVKFNGTVGSIFMPLAEIERRFNECNNIEKTILRALGSLCICGIYEENQVFPLAWIKIVAKKAGLEGEDFRWTGWLENLRDRELITLVENDKVRAEEVYLEDIFKPPWKVKNLDVFREAVTTFSGVPEALVSLGNRAYYIGIIDLEKANYMKIAIKAYEEALKVYTLDRFPMDYAMTQNNLGNAYSTLAEVEAKAENCKKAIKAYEEALKVRTLDRFPMDYAMTQNNLGTAYSTLAEVEAKAENCKKAIKSYEEALKVYTKKDFPEIYPLIEGNLRRLLHFCEGE